MCERLSKSQVNIDSVNGLVPQTAAVLGHLQEQCGPGLDPIRYGQDQHVNSLRPSDAYMHQ